MLIHFWHNIRKVEDEQEIIQQSFSSVFKDQRDPILHFGRH